MRIPLLVRGVLLALWPIYTSAQTPSPPGALIDIGGGQHMHLNCTGTGAPAVVLEGGAGDFSVIWTIVQSGVSGFTRVCSYDRAGFAWSDPGARPRTFSQMALELRTVLRKARVPGPYVLVGQSFGGSLLRGFAARYQRDVGGMVLVNAIHEDGYVFYGGQPHHLRDEAKGRQEPRPRIAIDTVAIHEARAAAPVPREALEPPLDRMPETSQRIWRWAAAQPVYRLVQPLEMEWSSEEAERAYQQRRTNPRSLGRIPLIVLARTAGEFPEGMRIPADSLERLRRSEQADLATLSINGTLRFAPSSGHNMHLEDPAFVVQAIRDVVNMARQTEVHARRRALVPPRRH